MLHCLHICLGGLIRIKAHRINAHPRERPQWAARRRPLGDAAGDAL